MHGQVSRRPQPPPPPIYQQIDRAMRSNDMLLAVRLAQGALDEGYVDPVLFNLRGWWKRQNGELEAALEDLRRAYELAPRSAKLLAELADCLNALGRPRLALTAAADALALDAAFAPAWYQQGLAQRRTGAPGPAKASFLRAVELRPALADAHVQLADLAANQGDMEEARLCAARALALRPGDAVALLALVQADLAEGTQAAVEERLGLILSDPRCPPAVQAMALGHLGDLRDRQQRHREAFEAYRQAGEAARAASQPPPETACEQVRRLIAELKDLPAAAWRGCGPLRRAAPGGSVGPVFILGFPRSGTTLLGRILASRPDVAVLEEKPLLAKTVAAYADARGGIAGLAALDAARIEHLREDFWARAARAGVELKGRVVLEQTAFNTAYLPLIARLFPFARIVRAIRDPRDVVFGCFRRQFAANPFTSELHTLESAARFYDAGMTLAELCAGKLGLRYLDIRNEDVIADFDRQTQWLCEFAGIAWDESMRDFHRAAGAQTLATASAAQIRKGLNGAGIGHWRAYREHLAPVMPILQPWIERFGYAAD